MKKKIKFEKYEESSLFGRLIIYPNKILSKDCGELIRSFKGHTRRIVSIQVDEKSNRLISGSEDSTIKF